MKSWGWKWSAAHLMIVRLHFTGGGRLGRSAATPNGGADSCRGSYALTPACKTSLTRRLDGQPFHCHYLQGIGGGAGAGSQFIIENHSVSFDLFPEMEIGYGGAFLG